MEGSTSAIVYVQEGIVTNANQSWLDLFCVASKDDLVGMPLMDTFQGESQAAIKGAIGFGYTAAKATQTALEGGDGNFDFAN